MDDESIETLTYRIEALERSVSVLNGVVDALLRMNEARLTNRRGFWGDDFAIAKNGDDIQYVTPSPTLQWTVES